MPFISLPNIYNTIFSDVDLEIRTFITLLIVNKIHEQINYSFLYNVKILVDYMALQKDREINCEIACLDEVFDLPQVKASTIFNEYHNRIVHIWEVRHVKYSDIPHFVFLLADGNYQCTCKLLMMSG
ncbi:protein far1-related sequence 5-like [Gigaspora margarita]|uniref:Protein far1-related sequence 5-like n=1 Tax=Gigaspora margarita TaxID=4874 RepID=A0A8H4B092_GIGMA|nr:protein far1-related sequence 5-like [Gigaspora margarita]